jgi:tRNA1(Val) A37 N6-methylase TrmN6
MDITTLEQLVARARARQDGIMKEKGQDYTRHDPDRLANFKRLAKDTGVDINKVWAIYAGKHWDAIMAFVKTGKVESEDIVGRLDDLHNYLYLFEAILSEREPDNARDVDF